VKGRKRHILVDTPGFLLAVYVTPADLHDSKGARCLLAGLAPRLSRLKKIWADAGNLRQELAQWCLAQGNWNLEVVERPAGTRFRGEQNLFSNPLECCGCLATYRKIKTPVIAPHDTALGVLELAFLDECEPQFPTEGIRWWVVNRWESVQRPILAVRLGNGKSLGNRRARDTSSLECGKYRPAHLIDILSMMSAMRK
jgi:transposase